MKPKFFDTNFNITKIRTNSLGEIAELELNHKAVELTTTLHAFKHSTSYIYTKEVPEVPGAIKVYTGAKLAKADAVYHAEEKTDVWTFNSKYYGADMAEMESTPKGTAGTAVSLGDYVLASDDKFYTESSSKWYEVLGFGKTADDMVISEEEVTDEDLLTELEAATAKALKYVLYTLADGITYSGNEYARSSTDDISIDN